MTSYQILVDVLDRLCSEAPASYRSYHPTENDVDAINSARAKAYLHLFLKVRFGLLDFGQREEYITEGAHDGGIDAYYIDTQLRVIYFLQAKFRTNEKNFEAKYIDPEELMMMDIKRILEGETAPEAGGEYNQKTRRMADKIREIEDIGRYKYRVVILANAKSITKERIGVLTGGFPTELINYKDCYTQLLFPLISGTYYNADQLQLSLSLSNKSAGAKISYTVATEFTNCEITVVFVPTLEIAKAMFKYRNSILKYNPRSYMGHEGKNVNSEIRRSIENRTTNEFALFNNGITILSDETYLNEKIGQKDRAQLVLVNPQIINGGQTAYTLSIIYRENKETESAVFFEGKEVLLKVITFESNASLSEERKLSLIQDISRATNQQTAVTNADRRSNEASLKELQKLMFDRTGLFIERKRGEFEDGMREGYIQEEEVIDRNLFFRAALAAHGKVNQAAMKKIAIKAEYQELLNVPNSTLDKYAFVIRLLKKFIYRYRKNPKPIQPSLLAKVYFGTCLRFEAGMTQHERDNAVDAIASELDSRWHEFVTLVGPGKVTYEGVGKTKRAFHIENYLTSKDFDLDFSSYLQNYR